MWTPPETAPQPLFANSQLHRRGRNELDIARDRNIRVRVCVFGLVQLGWVPLLLALLQLQSVSDVRQVPDL
jgi:hypothetical protein